MTNKILVLPIAHRLGLAVYEVLLDSDKYLLSYGTLINSFQPDVYDMTTQILSILIGFTQTSVQFFRSFFKSLDLKDAQVHAPIT